jgi:hypothetical protein
MGRCIRELIVHLLANSIFVEDIGDTTREEPKSCFGNIERLANTIVVIREDRECQTKLLSELLFGRDVLTANSDKVSTKLLSDFVHYCVKGFGLHSASRSSVGRIEIHNKGLLDLRASDSFAILIDE